ncbi:methyltransferase domain-containing protein [Chromobacterium vaccinii]|uniref:class I SAM-dependent methyltransferase n=1 Tax=Chromobacterium vaccinii TaxID=1108595 RepID=UPI001E2A9FAB|nr:methyltransferase domain-containing protein [Chromobacterium vaccinii]MCD4486159.1 methyltransferase domain-containing protein [Chromobacterium vaccinii]
MLKLNLGCGHDKRPGFINVDSQAACQPDQVVDLERFPWPWADASVDEIVMSHVLEHLGADTDTYLGIIKELYRVCAPDARVAITVPHPRSDNYLADPTHVRPITAMGLQMFNQELNRQSIQEGGSSTPLGIYLNVDWALESSDVKILEPWASRFNGGQLTEDDITLAVQNFYNVIGDCTFVMRIRKPAFAG